MSDAEHKKMKRNFLVCVVILCLAYCVIISEGNNCTCTPYYLCKKIANNNQSEVDNTCVSYLEVCCEEKYNNIDEAIEGVQT